MSVLKLTIGQMNVLPILSLSKLTTCQMNALLILSLEVNHWSNEPLAMPLFGRLSLGVVFVVVVVDDDRFYVALFSAFAQTHCTRIWFDLLCLSLEVSHWSNERLAMSLFWSFPLVKRMPYYAPLLKFPIGQTNALLCLSLEVSPLVKWTPCWAYLVKLTTGQMNDLLCLSLEVNHQPNERIAVPVSWS